MSHGTDIPRSGTQDSGPEREETEKREEEAPCRILAVQQEDSGRPKIEGIRRHGGEGFVLSTWDVPGGLPQVLDETEGYLPEDIDADLVLNFVSHPDVSQDLIAMCSERGVPVVAPGQGENLGWAHTPPV